MILIVISESDLILFVYLEFYQQKTKEDPPKSCFQSIMDSPSSTGTKEVDSSHLQTFPIEVSTVPIATHLSYTTIRHACLEEDDHPDQSKSAHWATA